MGLGSDSNAVNTNDQSVVEVGVALPTGTNSIGQVTANAGTNLNTSALNLEATQSDVKTSVQLIDDAIATAGSSITTKANAIAGTDGTNARIIKTDTTGNPNIVGNVASAATDSGNPVKIGSKFNSTIPTFTDGQRADLQCDSRGSIYVNDVGRRPTYAGSTIVTLASTPTDVLTISGSASKTVRILSISLSGVNTLNTNALIYLIKRSSANSGGTSSAVDIAPFDSNNPSHTASVLAYSANPSSLGTSLGIVRTRYSFFPALGSTNVSSDVLFQFGSSSGQLLTLNGTSQLLSVNFNGETITGTTKVLIRIEFIEE